jgi:hypothetical protein
MPWWYWAFEISHRLEARMMGRHPGTADRLGITHDDSERIMK